MNDILEIVQFIKDNAASKQDITGVRQDMSAMESRLDQKIEKEIASVRNDMKEMESRLTSHIDGLTKLTEKVDQQEQMLLALVKHLGVDLEKE